MMYTFYFCIFLGASAVLAKECIIQNDSKNPGLFVQNFGQIKLVVTADKGKIELEDGNTIYGYCTSGFWDQKYLPKDQMHTNVTFVCKSGTVYYQGNSGDLIEIGSKAPVGCDHVASYYESEIANCAQTGLIFGFNVDNTPVALAEVCFNSAKMSTEFIRYLPGVQSILLDDKNYFNVTSAQLSQGNQVNFSAKFAEEEKNAAKKAIEKSLKTNYKFVEYESDFLAPMQKISGVLKDFVSQFENTNILPWWNPLQEGNWNHVRNIMDGIHNFGDFEIYAGVSGVVTYPIPGSNAPSEPITYEVNNIKKNVPVYIWNYVVDKARIDPDVVIVGINSPFVEINGNPLCEDICDNYAWMNAIKNTRKMPGIGYVFCCRPDDIRHAVPNLPKLDNSSILAERN